MNRPSTIGLLIFGLLLAIDTVNTFPDGAPADTCVKKRVNQPNHGQARPQSSSTNPFDVVASSDNYNPGQQIQLVIYSRDKNTVFRGFFIQARDAVTNEWVGQFEQSPNTKSIPECASITHADNRDKVEARLIWRAPQHKKGRVYFTGTVLKEYGTFWSDIVAYVQN